MELKFFGWGVASNCDNHKSSLVYKDKAEAEEHCRMWNSEEGLNHYKPYRPVEIFQGGEPQRDAV